MIVCHCFGVTDSALKKLIVEEGVCSATAIARRTGAGSCCGPCREEVTQLLYSLSSATHNPPEELATTDAPSSAGA